MEQSTAQENPPSDETGVQADDGKGPAEPCRAAALMEGALNRLAIARRQLQRGANAKIADHIQSTMAIIGTLQKALSNGGDAEAASRLDALYDYMQGQLYSANARSDPLVLDEVVRLLSTVKSYEEWLELHRPEP